MSTTFANHTHTLPPGSVVMVDTTHKPPITYAVSENGSMHALTPYGDVEEVMKKEEQEHIRLAKEGRMTEAGAVAEGLPRVTGCELSVEYNASIDENNLKLVWVLDNGDRLVQFSSPVADREVFQKLEIDFTARGTEGELLAYVRPADEEDDDADSG